MSFNTDLVSKGCPSPPKRPIIIRQKTPALKIRQMYKHSNKNLLLASRDPTNGADVG